MDAQTMDARTDGRTDGQERGVKEGDRKCGTKIIRLQFVLFPCSVNYNINYRFADEQLYKNANALRSELILMFISFLIRRAARKLQRSELFLVMGLQEFTEHVE